MRTSRKLLVVVLFFLSACAVVPRAAYEERSSVSGAGRNLIIWVLSDIQPENERARTVFENAIKDVNDNIPNINLAVIAGDLLQSRSQSGDFEWFNGTRNNASITHWYEIAGNHDVRSGDIFWEYILKPSHYGVRVGNVLLLLMSDESTDSKTDISDEVFTWWRKSVENNQADIIITVTHAQLRRSGLFSSILKSRRIEESERFEDVLAEKKVAIWASGHSHLPQGMPGTVNIEPSLGGTCFINVSAVREDSFMDSQSRFFVFEEGSNIVWLRSRNHTESSFGSGLDIPLKIDKPFTWDGTDPQIVLNP